MTRTEHIAQAEMLMHEADQEFAMAETIQDWLRVLTIAQMSVAHANIAEAMRMNQ